MNFTKTLVLLGLSSVMFTGCFNSPEDDPEGSGNPVATGSGPDTLKGDIKAEVVLKNKFADSGKADYRVTADLNILAKVTVEPGVLIEVDAGKGILVKIGGSLTAMGLDTALIIMRGKENTQGYWKGVNIESNSNSNMFAHVVVENGGSDGFTGHGYKANITLAGGGRLKMSQSRSTRSGDLGLLVSGSEAVLADFSNNVFAANTGAPISLRVRHFAYLDTASAYTGNGKSYIENFFQGFDDDITGVYSVVGLDVPYELKGSHVIKGQLTILPGARFLAVQDAGLEVASSGFLKAVGTAEKPIEFSGKEDVAGYWRGIKVLSNSPSNELTHVRLSHGGSKSFDGDANRRANLFLDNGGRVKITHSQVNKSAKHGVWTYWENCSLEGFSTNDFKGNLGAGVHVMAQHFSYLDTASDYSGNTQGYVGDAYLGFQREVKGNHVWKALNVPYRLVGADIKVEGNITVLPGARFEAEQNAGVTIVSGGSFRAEGMAADSIYFRGAEGGTGIWKGFRFESNSTNNNFAFTVISGGGSAGFDGANRKANVEMSIGARFSISNSVISQSAGLGIRNLGGTLEQSDVVFSGNVVGDLLPAPLPP